MTQKEKPKRKKQNQKKKTSKKNTHAHEKKNSETRRQRKRDKETRREHPQRPPSLKKDENISFTPHNDTHTPRIRIIRPYSDTGHRGLTLAPGHRSIAFGMAHEI